MDNFWTHLIAFMGGCWLGVYVTIRAMDHD